MAETRGGTSAASAALERLRASQAAPKPPAPEAVPPASAAGTQPVPPNGMPAPPAVPPRPAQAPAFRHLTTHAQARKAAAADPASDVPHGLSDWLDHVPEPDWKVLGGRVAAAPGTLARRVSGYGGQLRRKAAETLARRSAEKDRLAAAKAAGEESREQAGLEAGWMDEEREAAKAAEAAEREMEAREMAAIEARRARKRREAEEARAVAVDAPAETPSSVDAGSTPARPAAEAAGPAAPGSPPRDELADLIEGAREAIVAARAKGPVPSAPAPEPTVRHHPVWEEDPEPLPLYIPPYNLPSTEPDPPEDKNDVRRRLAVSAAAVVSCVLGLTALGSFLRSPAHAAGGPFGPDFSLLSPSSIASAAWFFVFMGQLGFGAFQWRRDQRSSERQRSLGYPVAWSGLLGTLVLASAAAGWVFVSMVLALSLTGLLVFCMRRLNERTARSTEERIGMDAPVGLYLGWMLTVAPMSMAVWLTNLGVDIFLTSHVWASAAVVGTAWVATGFSMSERGRIVVALTYGWGLFWIMGQRLLGANGSALVAIVAGLCAFVVLLATENRRFQIAHAERRAARGQPLDF